MCEMGLAICYTQFIFPVIFVKPHPPPHFADVINEQSFNLNILGFWRLCLYRTCEAAKVIEVHFILLELLQST